MTLRNKPPWENLTEYLIRKGAIKMNIHEKIRIQLIQAIKEFITIDEILTDSKIRELAQDWVYENDNTIRDHLADTIYLDIDFEETLEDIDCSDFF